VNPVGPGLTHCSLCRICSSLPRIVTEVGLTIFFYCDHHCVQINSLLMLPREISALAQFCSLLGNSTLLHVLRETASDKYASSSSVQGF
jgi:hypothetical protein